MSFDLGRALEDLAEAGASRRSSDDGTLSARVGLMAGRIRRRRALRHAGTTVVAACAVGALAVGAAYLPALRGGDMPSPAAPAPTPDAALEPLGVDLLCGTSLEALGESGQLDVFSSPGDDFVAVGEAEVLTVTVLDSTPEVELRYHFPLGGAPQEIGWTVLWLADGQVAAVQQMPLTEAPASADSTSSEWTLTQHPLPCDGGQLTGGAYDVVAVAEANGVLGSGSPYLERVASTAVPVELPEPDRPDEPERNDVESFDVFTCGRPAPESVHAVPGAGGLTLAVDLPEGPWSWEDIPAIPATVGASGGQTILANLGHGVGLALVDDDGMVVGVARADSGDVGLFEITPTAPVQTQAPQLLVTCGPDGKDQYGEPLRGTFTAWPYVTAVLKEVTDAAGNATTPPADPVIVIATPQWVTLTD